VIYDGRHVGNEMIYERGLHITSDTLGRARLMMRHFVFGRYWGIKSITARTI